MRSMYKYADVAITNERHLQLSIYNNHKKPQNHALLPICYYTVEVFFFVGYWKVYNELNVILLFDVEHVQGTKRDSLF